MFNGLKKWLYVGLIASVLGAGWYLKSVFSKAAERDNLSEENKTLKIEVKVFNDSLKIYKEYLNKALIDTKNATDLYQLTKGMTGSIQSVIKVMRDSVISINKQRTQLETKVLELEKDLERAKKKRKFL